MAKLVKKQLGGFATNKNTISEKEMSKMKAKGEASKKKNAEARKKFDADVKNKKIVPLKVTKGSWFKKGGTVNTKTKK